VYVTKYNNKVQSNMYIKITQGNLKMCFYIQVKIICTIRGWGNEAALYRQ